MATAEPEEMNVKFFVTGVGGQLGHDVMNELLKRGHEGVGSDILTAYNGIIDNSPVSKAPYIPLDITDADAVERVITAVNPDAVIHCAAWTAVDLAENAENQEKVRAINAGGTQNIANVCKKLNCKMTYISTDYVFDGQGTAPWKPDCKDYKPLNVYGQTKLEGELAVSRTLDKYFIVRIAWVFGPDGDNFPGKILAGADRLGALRVVDDEFGNPTYAPDTAAAMAALVDTGRYGIYHLVNEGWCSRYQLARAVLDASGRGHVPVTPISHKEWVRPSAPPLHAVLVNQTAASLGIVLRPWTAAVEEYCRMRQNLEN